MKRQHSSSSISSSPLCNFEVGDEHEPVAKRRRYFVASPTPTFDENNESNEDNISIDENQQQQQQEELSIDEPSISTAMIDEESQTGISNEHDEEIIEIDDEDIGLSDEYVSDGIIIVSDSETEDDNNDDQGIDVTDEIPLSESSIISFENDDIEVVAEIIQQEQVIMDEETVTTTDDDDDDDDDDESLEIIIDNINSELIDLTADEPDSNSLERKLSTDVQQCPICLETLSDLQGTGVYLIITRCRHVMCTLCCRQLLTTSPRCPLCRENVSATSLIPYCILT